MSRNGNYIELAIARLASLGITIQPQSDNPILPLIERVAEYGESESLHIARVMQQAEVFNAAVRDRIASMEIANRYESIVTEFKFVKQDLQAMVGWMGDGKLSFSEKAKMKWMNLRRGTMADRFINVRAIYLAVARDAKEQLDCESEILEAYQDFRLSIKECEINAQRMLETANTRLQEMNDRLQKATADCNVEGLAGEPKAKADLARDECIRGLKEEDSRFQIILDLANNLKIAYGTSEAVFARLQQTHGVKERVYQQSVSFFSTNEVAFTALAATFNTTQGLAETTNTLEAMKSGIDDSLETLTELGQKQLEQGIAAGYGATTSAESVAKLVNAIVSFEETSHQMITDLRKGAQANAMALEKAVNDAKDRYSKLGVAV